MREYLLLFALAAGFTFALLRSLERGLWLAGWM